MKEVWIIAKRQQKTHGHGNSGDVLELATTDAYDADKLHPAFESQAAALEHIQAQPMWSRNTLEPVKVEVVGNNQDAAPDRLHLAAMDLARKQHDRIAELEAFLASPAPR